METLTPEAQLEAAADRRLDDAAIVARVRDGETGLFAVLVRRHNERLYRAARSILRNDAEAEDAMQQAYLNAFRSLHQFAGRASFATWLTRIAVHEALARLRRRRQPTGMDMTEDLEPDRTPDPARLDDPERELHAAEVARLLEAAIDALPIAYRCVFVLREVQGLSTLEAAESLEVSEDVVKTRLLRARALLRQELYERTGFASAAAFAYHRDRCDRMVAAVEGAIA
jgi:RNA polymerase sigma-70 factor (ECF subfamily)